MKLKIVNKVVMEDDTKVLTIEKIAEASQKDPTLSIILKDVCSRRISDSAKDTPYTTWTGNNKNH